MAQGQRLLGGPAGRCGRDKVIRPNDGWLGSWSVFKKQVSAKIISNTNSKYKSSRLTTHLPEAGGTQPRPPSPHSAVPNRLQSSQSRTKPNTEQLGSEPQPSLLEPGAPATPRTAQLAAPRLQGAGILGPSHSVSVCPGGLSFISEEVLPAQRQTQERAGELSVGPPCSLAGVPRNCEQGHRGTVTGPASLTPARLLIEECSLSPDASLHPEP